MHKFQAVCSTGISVSQWVLCRLYHALRQPTCLGTARPISTPLSVKIGRKVGSPKAEPPKRVRNRDVMRVTGTTSIDTAGHCTRNTAELPSNSGTRSIPAHEITSFCFIRTILVEVWSFVFPGYYISPYCFELPAL